MAYSCLAALGERPSLMFSVRPREIDRHSIFNVRKSCGGSLNWLTHRLLP